MKATPLRTCRIYLLATIAAAVAPHAGWAGTGGISSRVRRQATAYKSLVQSCSSTLQAPLDRSRRPPHLPGGFFNGTAFQATQNHR
jgi:hypothetical protein